MYDELEPTADETASSETVEKINYESAPNFVPTILSRDWSQKRTDEYHAYRKAWEDVPKNKIMLDFPIHLDIETTTQCNLKCPMCPRTVLVNEGRFEEDGFMSREEYKSIIDQGVAAGVKSIKLNYLGEPLLHKDVYWQVAYAKQKGVLDVLLNTNAAALTPQNARKLLEAGIDNVLISMDAINPADFAVQRVGTTLGRVIDNTYNFIMLRNEINPGCQVRVSMILYEGDEKWQRQFEGLREMWRGLADGVSFSREIDRKHEDQPDFPEEKGFHCAMPFRRMFLKNNGNVTICGFDDVDELVLGNWKETPLSDIWNSEGYRQIRELHASGDYYKVGLCRKCPLPGMNHNK